MTASIRQTSFTRRYPVHTGSLGRFSTSDFGSPRQRCNALVRRVRSHRILRDYQYYEIPAVDSFKSYGKRLRTSNLWLVTVSLTKRRVNVSSQPAKSAVRRRSSISRLPISSSKLRRTSKCRTRPPFTSEKTHAVRGGGDAQNDALVLSSLRSALGYNAFCYSSPTIVPGMQKSRDARGAVVVSNVEAYRISIPGMRLLLR